MRSDIALFHSLMEHGLPVCEEIQGFVLRNLNKDEPNEYYSPPGGLMLSFSPSVRDFKFAYDEAVESNIPNGLRHGIRVCQSNSYRSHPTPWFVVRSNDVFFCVKLKRTGESPEDLTIVDAQPISDYND
jgi:hypothetical protein